MMWNYTPCVPCNFTIAHKNQVAPPAEDGRSFKFNKQLEMETQRGPREDGDGFLNELHRGYFFRDLITSYGGFVRVFCGFNH